MRQERQGHTRARSAIGFCGPAVAKAAAAALALAVLGGAVGGCQRDSEKADVAVDQKVAQADMAMAYHPGATADAVQQATKAVAAAQAAVNEPGASDIAKANAQSELAIAQLNLAHITLAQVNSARAALGDTLVRMNTLSALLSAIGADVTVDQQFQPVAAQQTVTDEITAVQGTADKPVWKPHATAPIPSLAALTTKMNSLNNDIGALQQQRKQLVDDQTAAATKAADLTAQADKAHGKDAVDLYTQADDARKTANDKGAQIDQIDGQLQPMQQQLALAQVEATDLKSAMDAMNKTNSDLSDGWKKMQAQIDAETARAKDLVDGSGGPGARQAGDSSDTVNSLAKQWVSQAADLQSLRASAGEQLLKAKAALDSAVILYGTIQRSYSARKTDLPEAAQADPKTGAWTNMIDLHNPGALDLRLANVEETLADLYQGAASDDADQTGTWAQLQKALDKLHFDKPDALSSLNVTQDQKTNSDQVESAFKAADDDYTKAGTLGHSDAAAARAGQVIEKYDHGQFEVGFGDQATGESLIAEAKTDLANLQQANAELPASIPKALMPEPPATPPPGESPAPPAPTTNPSSEPAATQPAGS
jgi:hypothetical protein